MRKKLIIANWKCNPQTLQEAKDLFNAVKRTASKIRRTDVVVCPPFVYLPYFNASKYQNVKLGAQDVFWKDSGAYTGEISAAMLKNIGVKYVIIGHSERRGYFGETDEIVNKKVHSALKHDLKPILCIGERENEIDIFPKIIKRQLYGGLRKVSRKYAANIVLAYEPVWAIGTGKTVNPETLLEMSIYIRKLLAAMFGRDIAFQLPILYGGSADHKNANQFLGVEGIAGLLVGGASLDVKKFIPILKQV
ncbi:MAG: triose-phosphate isomerase [Candidatus Nealsonbacteria bacterium]|nr:MAG: triose-phosphate isomerase [Candidatus Nealsonbacteria bacterium]